MRVRPSSSIRWACLLVLPLAEWAAPAAANEAPRLAGTAHCDGHGVRLARTGYKLGVLTPFHLWITSSRSGNSAVLAQVCDPTPRHHHRRALVTGHPQARKQRGPSVRGMSVANGHKRQNHTRPRDFMIVLVLRSPARPS